MNNYLYRLLFMAVGICIALVPTAQAQFTIDAYIEAPPDGQSGSLTATCTIQQYVNTGLAEYFYEQTGDTLADPASGYDYYGQTVSTCVLYGPNNSEDSCDPSTDPSTASTNVYGSDEAECTITIDNPASGEYQVDGELDIQNWYDDQGYLCDPGVYWDPLDFEDAETSTWNGQATLYGTGFGFNCTDDPSFNIGTSEEILPYTAPLSVTVSPTDATLVQGDSEEFTATVQNGDSSQVTWSLSGPGTLSPESGQTQTVTYHAPDAYSASSATLKATSAQDTTKSATVDIALEVSPPQIQSVSTSSLSAGQTIITFTGLYLGSTPPSISDIAGVQINSIGTPTGESDGETQSVSFVVTVPNYIAATIVTFNIVVGDGAQNPNASITMGVQSQPPPPQIMINSTNLGNCQGGSLAPSGSDETDVFAGQQVQLCAPAPPDGCTITPTANMPSGQSWKFQNNADITGGFMNAANGLNNPGTGPPSGSLGGTSFSPVMNQSGLTFYFINSMPDGSETATYTWVLSNGDTNGVSSTADFNIQMPNPADASGPFFTAVPGIVNVWPVGIAFNGSTSAPGLEFGNVNTNVGMTFTATANAPNNQGAFQWVQLINSYTAQYLSNPTTPNINFGSGLDSYYPYEVAAGAPNTTGDSPGVELLANGVSALGEVATQFTANMYLMWGPSMNSGGIPAPGCAASTIVNISGQISSTASQCTGSIPIPLGYVSWGFSGCAINTLSNQTSTNTQWLLQCPTEAAPIPTFQPSSTYPQWLTTFHNTL